MSEGEPLKLITAEPVSPDVVEFIEEVLAMAKRGEISSIAMSYVFRDGSPGRGWSQAPSFTALLGSITITQAAIARYMAE